jgi:hypothetical protein
MPKPALKSSRLCGEFSPFYRDPERGGERMRDLCMRPRGHKGVHRWWGYVDNWNRETA